MSVPEPPNSLSGHCSAINQNTLYVLDNDGNFQSLPLKKNATWSEERSVGRTVNAPACVKHDGDGAFYVIGGSSESDEYLGLQRYFFEDERWETITPTADVLQNRVNHSAVYLRDSEMILVYAGSPENAPSDLSSQTFLLSTQPPYDVLSFTSNAPPANNPILAPWNSSHAVMVGGQSLTNQVWLFGPDEGWTQLPTDLAEPLDSASRAVIVDGNDGSKVLQVFNFHTSPNTAQGIVLLGEGGEPASTGQTVGGESSSRKRKRDLSLADWPSYNDTNAPTSTRTDCSIARNSEGLIVMAGGNDDEPLTMYDQEENSWVDADRFFNSKQQQPLQPTSSDITSAIATPTESVASTSTTRPASGSGDGSAHDRVMRTLGITLGVLCGIAALFVLILLFLRWRKLKAKKKDGYLEEKDGQGGDGARMSFADRGASFMKEAGLSAQDLTPPNRDRFMATNNGSAGSHTSLAIITGKWGNGNKRNTHGHEPKASFESTAQLVKDKHGNFIPTENHEMMYIGEKTQMPVDSLAVPGAAAKSTSLDKETRIERKRSSGWSKYFATSQPTGPNGLSHLPSAYVKPTPPRTMSVDSEYFSDDRRPSQASQIPSSVRVPPLDIDFSKTVEGQRLSHVASGSPKVMDSREFDRSGSSGNAEHGQQGQIVDPRSSQATSITSYDNRSTLSSNVTSEFYHEQNPWSPGDLVDRGRATSSVYTSSIHEGRRVPSRGKSAGFFPGAGTSYKPPKIKLSHAAGPSSEWASPKAPGLTNRPVEDRDSTVTVFPGMEYLERQGTKAQQATPGAQSTQQPTQTQRPANTDMSWLNLGLNKNQS